MFNWSATYKIKERAHDKEKSIWTESGEKPIVHYLGKAKIVGALECAESRAYVHAVDHPAYGNDMVRTSAIIRLHDNGDIETMNTIYRKL